MQSHTLPLTAPAAPEVKTNTLKAKILKGIVWVLENILLPLVFLLIVTFLVLLAFPWGVAPNRVVGLTACQAT